MKAQRHLLVLMGMAYIACIWAADSPDAVKGLWMTGEKDAVVHLAACADAPEALCGQIVWVKDADAGKDCGLQILRLDHFDGSAWRDGWIFDPRDQKKYKGVVRIKSGLLTLRAFVGTEVLGKTEQFDPIETLPPAQVCKA